MASSSAITTRTAKWELLRSAGIGDETLEQLIDGAFESGDGGGGGGPAAPHGVDVALGVAMLPLGQGGLPHQGAHAGVVGLVGQHHQLLVEHPQLLARLAQVGRHLPEAALDGCLGHWRSVCVGPLAGLPENALTHTIAGIAGPSSPACLLPRALVGRSGGRALVVAVAATVVLGVAGCGADGRWKDDPGDGAGARGNPTATAGARDDPTATAGAPCGPDIEEPLDPGSTQHLLPDAPEPSYATDPPTSGAHLAGGAVSGVQPDPLTRPVQVAVLEAGGVVVQHRGVAEDDRRRLERLAGGGGDGDVVVAPNRGLPSAVVATAWRHRLVCERAGSDAVAAIARFIEDHRGRGPEG